ncbi:MAG TPA: carboxylesterase [Gammaproteobacteria bacterium]|nr:carboxylesterase [Gammaproteobacteria bacterium]
MDSPTCIIHLPELQPDSSIIWLHGLGADAHDFEPLTPRLELPSTRFVFPNAPFRKITINNGVEMRAWFDFDSLDFSSGENLSHIDESIRKTKGLIQQQIDNGIDPERIILAGFSQGGVIALMAGLGFSQPLGGIVALSTYIPMQHDFRIRQKIPVIQCHGLDDPVIPYEVGLKTSRMLKETLGDLHEWHTYPMEHGICDPEIEDLNHWVHNTLEHSTATTL